MGRGRAVALGIAGGIALATGGGALAGCGSGGAKQPPGDEIKGTTLTIYSSVPLHGASSVAAHAVLAGEQVALADAHNRIGKYRIVLKPLDDSTPQRGEWDPGQTSTNAHVAMADPTTIGYIGEFNSGASAVSIPLLNRLKIAQISPTSTAVGLTSSGAGASPGEPDKYYPTGVRTFARIVPNDAVQAAAQVALQLRQPCRSTFVLNDGEVDGQDMATTFAVAAQRGGLHLAGSQPFDPHATDYRSLGTTVAQAGADCVLISAITENHAVLLTRQLAAALPNAKLFGTAGVAESTYADAADGGIPRALDGQVMITVATLDPGSYPPAGRAFYAAYEHRYGIPQPHAIYGYEAMSLMLSAISRATDHGRSRARRSKVVTALFDTRARRSVLGTYSITHQGDTTLRRYGVYRIIDGRLVFWTAIST
jgi:branched-chain amino acid transport system substrate-binding protein